MKTNKLTTLFFTLALIFGLGATAQVTTYPHTSDFEGSLGDWVNVLGDNGDFTVDANGTPSVGTGPSIAQSGSYYVFTETSGSATWGGQIWLECTYDMTTLTDATIDFWYHKWASNHPSNGPGILSLDVYDGTSWTYDVFRDELTNADAWKNANVDLSLWAGNPSVTLSWTVWVVTPQGWQCDIALDNIVVNAAGGGGGPPTCATIPYTQDFETGSTNMTSTTSSQSSATLDATSANASLLGLHLEGNTSSSWSSSYSTGALAFANSPAHIASVSREICAATLPNVTLTFDKKQTHSFNPNYCWFRLTVDGIPVPDDQGNIYYNSDNGAFKTFTYDLSLYAGQDFTVAWEGCMKYYYQYYNEGDNIYIDNISITETSGGSPPSAPGTISGNDYPNADQTGITYSVVAGGNVDTYTWTVPNGWSITAGQTTNTITVTAASADGDIEVYATNSYGTSSTTTLSVKSAEIENIFPYEIDFENEAQHSTTASATGFDFVANGWRNVDGDDGDWRADAGGTSSTTTGPGGGSSSGVADHNPGTSVGKYLYVEASSPNFPSKEFHLVSPPFDLTAMALPTLTFWYSMYNGSNPTLALQYSLDDGNTWVNNIAFMCSTISQTAVVYGNMGTSWRQGFVDLSSLQSNSNIMFRFIVTTGTSYDSDICLDDIKLVDAAATSISVGENLDLTTSAYSGAYGLILDGSSAQTITPNGNNVANITINNGNGVTLNGGDLKVDGVLTLTNGVLNTGSSYKVEISSTNANAISGGSTTAYINGNLRRYLATNTDTYAFPIGNGTGTGNYQRVDLINGSLAGVSYIDASTSNMGGGNMSQLSPSLVWNTTMLAEIFDKSWTLTPNTQPTGGTFGVNLYLNGVSGGTIQDNNFTIVKRPTGSTTWADWDAFDGTTTIPDADQPGRTVASGYMQKSGFISFSEFGGGGSGGGPLPIVLTYWDVEIIGESASLIWTVESQVNNDYYTIHKSLDCENWEEVARIPGDGTSNQQMRYQIFDETPYVGQSYYRLMQTDYDGKTEKFNIIGIFWDKPIVLSINPNPVEEVLTLYLSETLRGVTHVTIFNTKGQKIYSKGFIGNWKVIELDVAEYQKGYYLLDVDHNHRKGTLKFIKK